MSTPDFEAYYQDAIKLNDDELAQQSSLLPEIPERLIDSHTHSSNADFIAEYEMLPSILGHMMSTFPRVSIEQSRQIDQILMPGKSIGKLRFAHVYPGLDHRAITEYILQYNRDIDRTALFGLSETPEDTEYTISELRSGKYNALKMYYLSSDSPKSEVYEYFPPEILRVAQQEHLPIILHLPHSLYQSEHEVHRVAKDFPDLSIVLAHIGVANVPKPALDGILARFSEHPNVFVDTAMVDSKAIVLSALKNLGRDRVLYGSDEPLNLMRVVAFYNPDLQRDRVLTGYPYHWADSEEQAKWSHLATEPFVHSQWSQLKAILGAARKVVASQNDYQNLLDDVFYGNANRVFNFDWSN